MDLRETYDKIAENWSTHHLSQDWWVQSTEKFAALLKPGSTIFDIGCGSGTKARYFVDKGFAVTGIDFSQKMIELAKTNVPQADFLVADITEPIRLDKKFDAVYALAVLLHIPKKQVVAAIKNLMTVLNPGGYFYVAVKQVRPDRAEEGIVKDTDYGYEYERFFSFFALDEMKGYMKEAGLEIISENLNPAGRTVWIELIGKKTAE